MDTLREDNMYIYDSISLNAP